MTGRVYVVAPAGVWAGSDRPERWSSPRTNNRRAWFEAGMERNQISGQGETSQLICPVWDVPEFQNLAWAGTLELAKRDNRSRSFKLAYSIRGCSQSFYMTYIVWCYVANGWAADPAKSQIPRRMGRLLRSPLANFARAVGSATREWARFDGWFGVSSVPSWFCSETIGVQMFAF